MIRHIGKSHDTIFVSKSVNISFRDTGDKTIQRHGGREPKHRPEFHKLGG
jgi:hypothetical protein